MNPVSVILFVCLVFRVLLSACALFWATASPEAEKDGRLGASSSLSLSLVALRLLAVIFFDDVDGLFGFVGCVFWVFIGRGGRELLPVTISTKLKQL